MDSKDETRAQSQQADEGLEPTTAALDQLALSLPLGKKRAGRGAVASGLTHECGVFGAIATGEWPTQIDVAQVICLGLVALQHRGQESAGIVTSEGHCAKNFNVHKGMGMINNIFTDDSMKKLKGNLGIGHTRYSTSAASEEVNCQPFVVHTAHGALAVAHNGELVNCESLRKDVLERGVGLSTHSDSELITQALCLNPPEGEVDGPDWPARIKHLMQLAPLSYSLVIMLKDKIYGVRDPYGNRPLCIGKIVPLTIGAYRNGKCQASNKINDPLIRLSLHREGRQAARRGLGHIERKLRLPVDRRPVRAGGAAGRDRGADARRHQDDRHHRLSGEPAARVLHLRVRLLCPFRLDLRGADGVLGAAAVRPPAGPRGRRRCGHRQLGAGVGYGRGARFCSRGKLRFLAGGGGKHSDGC